MKEWHRTVILVALLIIAIGIIIYARSAPEGFLLSQSFGRDTLNVLNRGIFSIAVPAIGGAA